MQSDLREEEGCQGVFISTKCTPKPPPLACATLRAGLSGGPSVAAATLALGSVRGQEEVYSATADPRTGGIASAGSNEFRVL